MELRDFYRADEKEGDYRSEDGLLICGVCHEPKERWVDDLDFPIMTSCLCEKNKIAEIEEKEKAQAEIQERERVKEEVKRCFRELGQYGIRKVEKMTFDNDRYKDSSQSEYCRKYSDNFESILRDNIGVVLWGSVGAGKTFLANCICNRVIEKGYSALFCNLSGIAQKSVSVKETEREDAKEAISTPDLIVFDDLGVERRSEYMDEAVYTVVNTRYMVNKPAIFTTNLRATDFKNPKDENQKRLFSRIVGMCDFVQVEGSDKRIKEHNNKKKRLERLLSNEEPGA